MGKNRLKAAWRGRAARQRGAREGRGAGGEEAALPPESRGRRDGQPRRGHRPGAARGRDSRRGGRRRPPALDRARRWRGAGLAEGVGQARDEEQERRRSSGAPAPGPRSGPARCSRPSPGAGRARCARWRSTTPRRACSSPAPGQPVPRLSLTSGIAPSSISAIASSRKASTSSSSALRRGMPREVR